MPEIEGQNYCWLEIKDAGSFSWGLKKGMNETRGNGGKKMNETVKSCSLKEQAPRGRKIKGKKIKM